VICRPDQDKDEYNKIIHLVMFVIKSLKFNEYTTQITLRDPNDNTKYIGTDENWNKAEQAIQEAASEMGLTPKVEIGEAAFYGPKLDFMVKDALGRTWQLGTIQVDYNLPERFELEYRESDNQMHRPIMLHRAIFGSMERFVAVLIEHTAGKFPLWLTPHQVVLLPISEKYNDYAKKVLNLLKNYDIRGLIDERNEKIGRKIRDNELKRIPYLLIIGEKEMESGNLSIRKQAQGDLGTMSVQDFADLINTEINKYFNN
jgi:threonyl-tRNA synthetase